MSDDRMTGSYGVSTICPHGRVADDDVVSVRCPDECYVGRSEEQILRDWQSGRSVTIGLEPDA